MPDQPTEPSEPLDVRTIHHLVKLMQRYDLTAIDIAHGPIQVRLRRRGVEPAATSPVHPTPTPPPMASPPAPRPEPAPPAPLATPTGAVIESPMVGTYYSSSGPDAPPYVSVGSVVRSETVVCIIEAMKVFTEIPAGVSGTITEILVKNGQPVEYGQPLFRVSQE